MKKLLLIPTMLFPYSFGLFSLIYVSSLDADFAEHILLGFFALSLISPLICNIIFLLLSRKDDAHSLIGAALLVKLVHIPSYIFIFLLGVGASIMIFMTFALILMLILFDYMVLASSGMISVFALAKNIKNNKIISVIALICQFFFCADVISLFVLWINSKNSTAKA